MIHHVTIDQLLSIKGDLPIADVRTPAEFEHGHIPAAHNLPLFSNEDRVKVGTTYKQEGQQPAILLGFELVGPRWAELIRTALLFSPQKKIALHCWRGGMRSGAVAWALDLYGFDVYLLKGGYKHFRRWAIQQFSQPRTMNIVGGMTGSGKTRVLHELQKRGEDIIDLEALAQHQGSAYGSMNKLIQPTQEQFENELGLALHAIPPGKIIWVEDESSSIGKRIIPRPFWHQMMNSPLIDMKVSIDARVASLAKEYGILDKEFLSESTQRIHKRLGPLQTKLALDAIAEDRMEDFVRAVLVYYDKTYKTCIAKRENNTIIPIDASGNPVDDAMRIIDCVTTAQIIQNGGN